jgi:hypothetical protein
VESVALVGSDDDIHCLCNVGFLAGLSEKVDIRGHAVQEAVGLNCVPARKCETERSGCIQRDAASRS